MEYILIFLLGILATAKMSFQTAFCKNSVKNSIDAIWFNMSVFITVALIFMKNIFGCSNQVWIYAVISASFTVMFQLFYAKALSVGNVSLTVLISNFSMVINVLVSYLFFDDPISTVRLVGICLTVVAFIITTRVEDSAPNQKNWLVFALLTLLANSGGSIVQKCFGESPYGGENQAYISCMYISASVISFIVLFLSGKKEKRSFKLDFKMIKFAVLTGVSLGVYQLLFTYSLANIDGTFIFPAQAGTIIILSTLAGVLMFKDKFTKKQLAGIVLGFISLILVSY